MKKGVSGASPSTRMLGVLVGAMLAYPGAALAQPSSGIDVDAGGEPWSEGVSLDQRQQARQLFLEGNRFFKIPIFPRAIERYEAAVAIWPHPRFYFNLAVAQLNHGDDVAARQSFERSLAHGDGALGQEQHAEARRLRAEIEGRLGRVRVTCTTRGAAIAIDGKHALDCAGDGELLVWLGPGAHELGATKSGYLPVTQEIAISAGDITPVSIALITLGEAHDESRRWPVWIPWSVLGTGAAIIAVGAGVHSRAASNYSAHDDRFVMLDCIVEPDPISPGCPAEAIPPDLDDTLRRADRQQRLAVGLYVAGGALLAAGVALQVLNRARPLERGSRESSPAMAEIVPVLSRDFVGASARLHFGGM